MTCKICNYGSISYIESISSNRPGSSTSVTQSFQFKRGDTCPSFEIQIKDPITGASVSFEDWLVQAYMWFETCLGEDITVSTTEFKLLGNKLLCQVKIGDIIEVDDCDQNQTEYMEVVDVDAETETITVTRGAQDSDVYSHKKKDKLLFFRIFGNSGYISSEYEDDISTTDDEEDFSLIRYDWLSADTTHTGDYLLEFKLQQETEYGENEVIRSFPKCGGYPIQICE